MVYRRDGQEISVLAEVGRTQFQVQQEVGALLDADSRDYLISVSDLVLDGDQVEPTDGDLIVETVGGATRTFRVSSLGDEPCFVWDDGFADRFRIHTKLVGIG